MGNLGWTEMIFIAMIALMVFGPKRLPEMGRKLGRIMGQLRQASDQFKQVWDSEVEKANLKDIQQKVQNDLSPNNLFSDSTSKTAFDNTASLTNTTQTTTDDPISLPSINSSTDISVNSQVAPALENQLINPPAIAPIERSKPSFDLSPNGGVETISQTEEVQPISLTKN
ncbi:MAG: twin-arginine translocase subunit TatB [Acidobacteria bacterium]|nr:twin-arginine translocase subunit TatB [Acidobacteriota bacterium]